MPALFSMSASGSTTMTVIFPFGTPTPQRASRPPGGLHLLRGPLHKRPSTPRSVKSSAFARFFMAATLFKILFAAFLTQNPLAARFFFMAGDMATWQQNRPATDERWGPAKKPIQLRIKPALRGRSRAENGRLPRQGERRQFVVGVSENL